LNRYIQHVLLSDCIEEGESLQLWMSADSY
jgi:hypothetical protein